MGDADESEWIESGFGGGGWAIECSGFPADEFVFEVDAANFFAALPDSR
jgi:hypothetical protein